MSSTLANLSATAGAAVQLEHFNLTSPDVSGAQPSRWAVRR